MARTIRKGDRMWLVGQGVMTPVEATVVVLTDYVGKQVGLEFDEQVGVHNCDGHGKQGYCIWVCSWDLMTQEEYASKVAADAVLDSMNTHNYLDEYTF